MKKTVEAFDNHLISKGLLDDAQVQKVRRESQDSKESFKKTCVKLGYVTEETYALAEAEFLQLPFANLEDYIVDPEVLKLVPQKMAKQYSVFPLFHIDGTLTLAVHDPQNIFVIDQIRESTHLEIELVLATESDILDSIREHYGTLGLEDAAKMAQKNIQQQGLPETRAKSEKIKIDFGGNAGSGADEAPVIKLVDQTILQALEDKASDIHIEPESEFLRIRNRIDGALIEVAQLPKQLQNPIISRIKIMAKLDIAERRLPQDGKIRLSANGKDIDIRVSSFPTTHGENIVLRILDRSNVVLDLNRLGFKGALLAQFRLLLQKPYGIILATGPTGSGKTTTLYSALQEINTVDKNIMTIEDPIEYQIPMIRQTQVNVKAGLTFATGLRSLLRQDPDIMLVGEIRDKETAEIAVESALTGHLVFSTLHTNDSTSSATRLIDMGVEPFLISSTMVGALAQRLVRTICAQCRKEKPIAELHLQRSEVETLMLLHRISGAKGEPKLFVGEGCKNCKRTGYRGRAAIFELMTVDEKLRGLIARNATSSEFRKICFNEHNLSLKMDGFRRVLEGVTTVEEVLKVVQDD